MRSQILRKTSFVLREFKSNPFIIYYHFIILGLGCFVGPIGLIAVMGRWASRALIGPFGPMIHISERPFLKCKHGQLISPIIMI